MNAANRFSEWWHREWELDVPAWCRPRRQYLGAGVTVETTYGYHVIVALFYTVWRKLVRRGR